MYDVDTLSLLAREVLRERTAALVEQACAWTVGLSDQPHFRRRHGRVVATGATLGELALADLPMGSEEDGRLELGEAAPGTFRDALGGLTAEGTLHADLFEEQVLAPFVLETCVRAAQLAAREHPAAWAELLEDLGEDGTHLAEVVSAAEWEAPLRIEAEQLVLAAIGDERLVEVEAGGLPLSIVQAAEAMTRRAVPARPVTAPTDDVELAGSLLLADAALREGHFEVPVPPAQAGELVEVLLDSGLEPEEVLRVLPHLPVPEATVREVGRRLDGAG